MPSPYPDLEIPHSDALAMTEEQVVERFRARFDIADANVLEIGGAIDPSLTVGVHSWISIDPRHRGVERRDHATKLEGQAETPPIADGEIDFVFACNSLEHVGALAGCYRAMRRVLKPGGALYGQFGPIWSAPDGAHFEDILTSSGVYSFWDGALVPSWAHLVLAPHDFRDLAREINGDPLGNLLADYVEVSTWVNRYTVRDHLRMAMEAGFEIEFISGGTEFGYEYQPPSPPRRFAEALSVSGVEAVAQRRYGLTLMDLHIRDLEMVLRKPRA